MPIYIADQQYLQIDLDDIDRRLAQLERVIKTSASDPASSTTGLVGSITAQPTGTPQRPYGAGGDGGGGASGGGGVLGSGAQITGGTITGGLIQTAFAPSRRVSLVGATGGAEDRVLFYSGSPNEYSNGFVQVNYLGGSNPSGYMNIYAPVFGPVGGGSSAAPAYITLTGQAWNTAIPGPDPTNTAGMTMGVDVVLCNASNFLIQGQSPLLRLGYGLAANTPEVRFASSALGTGQNPYDTRIYSTGGSATNGTGTLTVQANTVVNNADVVQVGSSARAVGSRYLSFWSGAHTGTDAYIRVDNNGDNTGATAQMHLLGGEIFIDTTSTGVATNRFTVNSVLQTWGLTTTTASAANLFMNSSTGVIARSTSSLRYKEDVRLVGVEQAAAVLDLQPFLYKSKGDADTAFGEEASRDYIGLAAEDADMLGLHELVDYDAEGEPNWLMYERVVPLLLPIIKDLRERVETLENGPHVIA